MKFIVFLKIYLFILFIGFFGLVKAQKIDDIKKEIDKLSSWSDTNYVYRFPHRIVLSPTFFLRTNSFLIEDVSGQGEDIIYKPNTPMKLALSGSYKWLSLGFYFKLPSYLNDKGNTESFSLYLGTQTHFANWGLDFFFIKNQGYYLSNPEDLIDGWTDRDPYPFRSDLKTLNIGFSSHIVLSRKLSLKAALNQTEKQLKSAGGFAIQVGMNYSNLRNDTSLIPASQQEFYQDVTLFRKGGYVSVNIRPGYAYTYVYKDFYSTSFLLAGIGVLVQSYELDSKRSYGAQIMPQFRFQQVFGYNTDNAFVKLMLIYNNYNYKVKNMRIRNNFVLISLGGGIRIM